jgi:hypothetical protein
VTASVPPNRPSEAPQVAGGAPPARAPETAAESAADADVQKTRARTGLYVVIGGDVTIALAAILGIGLTSGAGSDQVVAILASAFTAISSMTSAYFGIRAASNTAQSSFKAH